MLQSIAGSNRRPRDGSGRRRRRAQRCGICQGCSREDCGHCRNCKDKVKFGGPGTKKQRCMLRTCINMVPYPSKKLQKRSEVYAVKEKDLTSIKVTCVFCGRKRKKGLTRSAIFCTKHCQTMWEESHPGELPPQEGTMMYSPPHVPTNTSCDTLDPSPTPLSSPALYTPPTSRSRFKINKWKEIAKKLSIHRKLRSVWNELKLKGGFTTNEHFISHLLRFEAERQCIHYDMFAVNTPMDGSDDASYSVDMSNPIEINDDSPISKQPVLDSHSNSCSSCELEMDIIGAERNAQRYQQSTYISSKSELTLLDSEVQYTQDDADAELSVDEVIDYL